MWPDISAVLSFARLNEARTSGYIRADVGIVHNEDAIIRTLTHINTAGGKKALVTELDKARPPDIYGINWSSIVESSSNLAIDTWRAGDAAVKLSSIPEQPTGTEVQYLVEPIVLLGQPTLIYGDGGSGKSYFATFSAVLTDQQGFVDPSHGLGYVREARVLYLDWETDVDEIASRVRRIHNGLGITSQTGIVYRAMEHPLTSSVDRILDICHEFQIDYIIYDSMGLACGGELESAEVVLAFFRAVRQIGGSSLIISHTNKSGGLFGSQYTQNSSRSVFELKKTSTASSNSIHATLVHRKVNNVQLLAPTSWVVEFSDSDKVTLSRQDTMLTESASEISYQDFVMRFLRDSDNPISRGDLARTIAEFKPDDDDAKVGRNVASSVSKLKARGLISETNGLLHLPNVPDNGGEDTPTSYGQY